MYQLGFTQVYDEDGLLVLEDGIEVVEADPHPEQSDRHPARRHALRQRKAAQSSVRGHFSTSRQPFVAL